jgi:hypothetical protein
MNPKFNINEFEKLKNTEILFECEICKSEFISTKKYLRRALGLTKSKRPPSLKYCSKECIRKGKMTGEYKKCKNCETEVYRSISELKSNENVFCGNSCKAIFWNKEKNYGTNRSKIEIWIEEELKSIFDFEILFNDRKTLDGYEIDIYIPSLKIAFELNGIFHYLPIFGNDKLKVIENRDLEKFKKCEDKNIKLYVIDITDSKKFDKIKDKKYLDFIVNKLNENV